MKKCQPITETQDPHGYLRLVIQHSADRVTDLAVLDAAAKLLLSAVSE